MSSDRQYRMTQGHGSGLAQGFVYAEWIDQAGETLELMRRHVSRIVQVELESHNKNGFMVEHESVLALAARRSMLN
jgi:hypothetical protein